MARIHKNPIAQGLRGQLGKQLVFKQYGDKTIVSVYPDMSRVKPSPLQLLYQNKFAAAMAYAKQQNRNREMKAAYMAKAKGMQRAVNVAIADFYHAPKVESISARHFKGRAGDSIGIHATDDFRVVSVKLVFSNRAGEVLHEGQATEKKEWYWVYVLPEGLAEGASQLQVTATDLPGNATEAVFELGVESCKM